MVAELNHIESSAARWRFAAGCVRVALTPQRPRWRGLAGWSVVVAAVVLLSLAIGPPSSKTAGWIAGNLLATVTIHGLYLAFLVAGMARATVEECPAALPSGGPLRAVILLGAAAAIGLDAFVLLRYPEVRSEGNAGWPGYAATVVVTLVVLAVLATYVWLGVTRTRARHREALIARRYGLIAGSLAGALLVAASSGPVPAVLIVAAAGVCAAAAGHLASRAAGNVRSGLVAGVWAGLVAGLVLFVVGAALILVTRSPAYSTTMLADLRASGFHDPRSFSVAGAFGLDGDPPLIGALVPLLCLPLLCVGLAAFGATRGDRRITWRHLQVPPPTPT
jgi:hypothetical protein